MESGNGGPDTESVNSTNERDDAEAVDSTDTEESSTKETANQSLHSYVGNAVFNWWGGAGNPSHQNDDSQQDIESHLQKVYGEKITSQQCSFFQSIQSFNQYLLAYKLQLHPSKVDEVVSEQVNRYKNDLYTKLQQTIQKCNQFICDFYSEINSIKKDKIHNQGIKEYVIECKSLIDGYDDNYIQRFFDKIKHILEKISQISVQQGTSEGDFIQSLKGFCNSPVVNTIYHLPVLKKISENDY